MNYIKSLISNTAYWRIEEDIQNYSPIVMFRGTPCIYTTRKER